MKRRAFLLSVIILMVLSSVFGQNNTYIKDVMLIGGSNSEVTDLKASLLAEGWIDSEKDLNDGADGDFIYMHFTTATAHAGHQPQGSLVCEGGVQEISVSGWAFQAPTRTRRLSFGLHK